MATRLVIVESASPTSQGLLVSPGIGMNELATNPVLKGLGKGARLELRLPGGDTRTTSLAMLGVSVREESEGVLSLSQKEAQNPEVKLYLPSELDPKSVPPGTEVWWLRAGRPKWLTAYLVCVVLWGAADCALDQSGSFFFGNFFRLPLQTAVEVTGSSYWCDLCERPVWSVGTLVVLAYAAVGFLPLAIAAWTKRTWPYWLVAAFVLAHPALWFFIVFVIGPHP